jgi:hypothetical protein
MQFSHLGSCERERARARERERERERPYELVARGVYAP